MVHAPRRNVFVATVNPPQLGYLIDESGNRRMLPVECGVVAPIDLEGISADREQIWAEAVALYLADAKWWPATREEQALCNQEQTARMVAEVWEGKIAHWLDDGTRRHENAEVTVRQILSECLAIPAERWDRSNSTRVGACLARLKWVVAGQRGSGDRERFYRRAKDEPPVSADDEERAGIEAQ
jgi:putative DNA primase/helicase